MCLIAYRERKARIPSEVIEYNGVFNPDGFGLMWRDGKEVRTAKFAPDEFVPFANQLAALDADRRVEYAAHWRRATHGLKNKAMAHPYRYKDADGTPIALMHNGVIDIDTAKSESDTWAFVDTVLSRMRTGWWDDGALRFLVESTLGWGKALMMTPTETVMLNARMWRPQGGIDYSCEPLPTLTKADKADKGKDDTFSEWDGLSDTTQRSLDKAVVGGAITPDGREHAGWNHVGHLVVPTSWADEDYGNVTCTECHTEGEFYIIDDKAYMDIDHYDVAATATTKALMLTN